MDARKIYTAGDEARAREQAAYEARSRAIGTARLVVAAGAIALLAAIVWVPLPTGAWGGELGCLATFIALVVVHARIHRDNDRAAAARRFHRRGLDRLDGKWTAFASTGERFRSAEHPYTDDLDIFGSGSLFQHLDATETRFGEERLAELLANSGVSARATDVRARQEAITDLASRVEFREKLSALGALLGAAKPDSRPFLEWAEGGAPFPHSPALRWAARIVPAIVVALFALASIGPSLHPLRTVGTALLVVELLITLGARGSVGKVAGIVASREAGLLRHAEMFEALEAESFTAPLLRRLQERLRGAGETATREMRALGRILSFLEARNNEVFKIFIAPFLLWDLNCVIALERWRQRSGKTARGWFDILGEFEALATLAGFAFERPDHAMPEFADTPVFDAEQLGHPLLPSDRRVPNNVCLPSKGFGLIVTGSNMSGKSTLLRAMGINAVLALAGAPVCAAALRMGPMRVATSMRVRDSLQEGVSHFFAELQKLKRVVDMARHPEQGTVIFLLDEILHGTNSRERIIGARAVIRELLVCGALGAVSTHDLGISELERELAAVKGGASEGAGGDPPRLTAASAGSSGPAPALRNVHFEEQVDGDTMTFDYRLREGIVQSSNALRLMRLVGIDVVSFES